MFNNSHHQQSSQAQSYKHRSPDMSHPLYQSHPNLPQDFSFPSKQPHHHLQHSLSSGDPTPHHEGTDIDSSAAVIHAPSYSSSVSSSSYAGSAADEASDENEVDLIALLTDRLSSAFDPIPLDRSLAIQAQTSGMLNSKTRELIALQEEAAARLAQTKKSFIEGMKVAKEVKLDLDYVYRRVINLQKKTQQKYPAQYTMARERIPPPPS